MISRMKTDEEDIFDEIIQLSTVCADLYHFRHFICFQNSDKHFSDGVQNKYGFRV